MRGKNCILLLLLSVAIVTTEDGAFASDSATKASVNGAVDSALTAGLVGTWKVRWAKNGWEATRTFNGDGTFTSSDAGPGIWTLMDQTIVLSFRNYKERFELPLKADGTKVIGWKNREYLATKLDLPKTTVQGEVPPPPKVSPIIPPKAAQAPQSIAITPRTPRPVQTPPSSTPAPFFAEATAVGLHHITFKARIDSNCWIVIQDGRMFLDSRGSAPAEHITVNSRKWNATFSNGVSEDFKFGEPLMPFNGKTVSAKLTKSRGSMNIRELPTAANGEKLVIQLEDNLPGPGDFDLVISW